MVIHLKNNISAKKAEEVSHLINAINFHDGNNHVLITSSKLKAIPEELNDIVDKFLVTDSDIQLASRLYKAKTRQVKINNVEIGGETNHTLMIAGPCSIENEAQIKKVAILLKNIGVTTLRAGCFKPRTSPYSFQGLGLDGLKMLKQVREEFGLNIISEVRDATHVEDVIEYVDIIQIGTKAMYDHGILRACGAQKKPVLLKRGFGTTLQELVQAAEFILSAGNGNVILCERGIRTFETKTRFTLDLCGVAFLKKYVNLPIVLDPSHAMGYRYGVPDLVRACVAMGVDGLLIETHPVPEKALSDAAQQLSFSEFEEMYLSLGPIAKAVGRKII